MAYKFERLDVWQRSLEYVDRMYAIADHLPSSEKYNLTSQIRRAATSISLNVAEGSTGLSDAEQSRFLRIAIRPLLETVACLHLIKRRGYVDAEMLRKAYRASQPLFAQLQAFRASLRDGTSQAREVDASYEGDFPF